MKNELKLNVNYENLINEIATAPESSSLSDKQLSAIAQYVLFNRYAKQMDNDINLSQYNINKIVDDFFKPI